MLMSPYDDGAGAGAAAAILAVVYGLSFLFGILGYLIAAFLLMKIFDKAGVQGKWRAFVPFYNVMVAAKLADISPWVALIVMAAGFIPILNALAALAGLALLVMIALRFSAKLDKPWPLLFLGLIPGLGMLIWLAIHAFTSSGWNTHVAHAPWANSFLADKTRFDGIPVQSAAGGIAGYGGYGGYSAPGAYPPPASAAPPAYDPPPASSAPPGYTPPPTPPTAPSTAPEPPATDEPPRS